MSRVAEEDQGLGLRYRRGDVSRRRACLSLCRRLLPGPFVADFAACRSAHHSSATASELPAEEEPAEPLGEPVNVLWGGPSSVAVSSTAKGGRPSALVDGGAATAWEAAVGDTPGAAISVVVPSGTTITELMLTAGFDGTSPAGKDLFSSHSRARKIRITALPGTTFPTFEWTLDPTLRTPQRVPFSVPAHREEEGPLAFSVLVLERDEDGPP
ncbi:hypothetical protein OUZ56_032668, partial [Daphnia magna]